MRVSLEVLEDNVGVSRLFSIQKLLEFLPIPTSFSRDATKALDGSKQRSSASTVKQFKLSLLIFAQTNLGPIEPFDNLLRFWSNLGLGQNLWRASPYVPARDLLPNLDSGLHRDLTPIEWIYESFRDFLQCLKNREINLIFETAACARTADRAGNRSSIGLWFFRHLFAHN